ncbi:MAG: hypothetical protein O3B47_05350, partial [bacterium]|nr:hypothetical protein [bacterium]
MLETPIRTEILESLHFEANGRKPVMDCSPAEVFQHDHFKTLLGKQYGGDIELFDKFMDPEAEISPEEIDKAARAFRIALLTWHTKLTWLDRVADYDDGEVNPYDTSDLVRVITNAAEQFMKKLQRLGFQFVEDVRVNDFVFRGIRDQIEDIHERVVSVVKYSRSPVALGHHVKDFGIDISKLNTVGDMQLPSIGADLFFGGSKRSDLAAATNGDKLLKNLAQFTFNPEDFDILTLRLSGRPVTLVVPNGAQGNVGLKELFAEVGVLIDTQEVEGNPDIFFLGVPDELFEGVEGIVQGKKDGKLQTVGAGYKRFHATAEDGTMFYVVGKGKDDSGNELDYFGPFKKAAFQFVATRELQEATQLLARTGRKVTQPSKESGVKFKYHEGEREIKDGEAFAEMVVPFHGTTLFWDNTGLSTDAVNYNLNVDRDTTINHTLFEGQSGMGKSEMEQYIKVMLRNSRLLFDVMMASENPSVRGRAAGLSNVKTKQVFSSGDDMGHLYMDPRSHRLVSTTHERARFTRTDNLPKMPDMQARKTHPLDEKGVVASTSNTRVLQRDTELEAFHQTPMAARIFVLATNLPLDVDGLSEMEVVQKLDMDQYMKGYAGYRNQPNGTKDSDDPVNSPGAIHEFAGQFATAGTVACENLVETRRFILKTEEKRRKTAGQDPMRFFAINSGIAPDWIAEEDIQARLAAIEDDNERETERQKMHFANAANSWKNVTGLLPPKIRKSFIHAE